MLRRKRSLGRRVDDDTPKIGPLRLNDQPHVVVTADGVIVRRETDGSFTLRQPDGSEYAVDAEGHNQGTLRTVASVTVADIAFVTEHRINTIYGKVSHVVRFRNGGTQCYSVDSAGWVLDCEFSRLQVLLANGHMVAGCTEVALALTINRGKLADRLPGE
ncbi:hypothetical protein [Paraburkholderia aspalathi]|uniref:hypothetical protein n=1 Tax=Paraburkholderia aspalathi TaxID=1324617 RepID=UPI0038BA15DB